MGTTEYVPVKDLNINGINPYICCPDLMLNGMGSWYCKSHKFPLGYDNAGAGIALIYCASYKRDSNCFCDLKEKAEKEKAEKEEKAFFNRLILDFNEAIRLNPNDAENYRLRGGAYAQRKEYDQAIADFNEAIRLNPNDAEAYAFRGSTYAQKKADNQALADLNEAIRLNPNCKNAYLFRAAMYGAKGEHNKSVSDYKEALRIDPQDSAVSSLLENTRRERREKMKETARKIGRMSALFLAVLSIIMVFVARNVALNSIGIGDLIFIVIIFTIPFLVIFFCEGWIKKSIFLCAGIFISISVLRYYSNDVETPFIMVSCISYIISCITAMIFPKNIYGNLF